MHPWKTSKQTENEVLLGGQCTALQEEGGSPNLQGTADRVLSLAKPPAFGPTKPAPNISTEPLQQHSYKEGCETGAPLAWRKPQRAANPASRTSGRRVPAPSAGSDGPSHLIRALTPIFQAERGRSADARARVPLPERAEMTGSPNHRKASSSRPEASSTRSLRDGVGDPEAKPL